VNGRPDLSWWTEHRDEIHKFIDMRLAEIDQLPKGARKPFVDHVVRCAGCRGTAIVEVIRLTLPNGAGVKAIRFLRRDQRPLDVDFDPGASAQERAQSLHRGMKSRQPTYRRNKKQWSRALVLEGVPLNGRARILAACNCRTTPYLLSTSQILNHEISIVGNDTPAE
jgi:hypothetical protein